MKKIVLIMTFLITAACSTTDAFQNQMAGRAGGGFIFSSTGDSIVTTHFGLSALNVLPTDGETAPAVIAYLPGEPVNTYMMSSSKGSGHAIYSRTQRYAYTPAETPENPDPVTETNSFQVNIEVYSPHGDDSTFTRLPIKFPIALIHDANPVLTHASQPITATVSYTI